MLDLFPLLLRKKWASRLFELITEPEWTLTIVKRIITGKCTEEQYNQEMNDIFVKLHLLDPYKVLPTYHYLLQQKGLYGVKYRS